MGNRLFKKQEVSSSTDQTVGAEPKLAQEPMTTQPEDAGATGNQEAAESGKPDLDIVVPEEVTPALPKEECIKCEEPPAAALQNEAGNLAKEAPVLDANVSSPPEPAAVPQLAAEPKSEPNVEPTPEPISESVPAEPAPEGGDTTEESVRDPTPSPPPSDDPAIPDLTSQPDEAPAAPADIPAPVSLEVTSDAPAEECSTEGVVIPMSVPEKAPETSELLKSTEEEAAGNSEKLLSDISVESISGQLKQLELSGSDLVADLIPSDIKMSADTTVADTNASTELM